jgi:hypothetical protein
MDEFVDGEGNKAEGRRGFLTKIFLSGAQAAAAVDSF